MIMKRKLLIGLIVLLVIAAVFFLFMITAGAAIAVWIYLAWMVWKKKTQIFHNQMEPELAKKTFENAENSLIGSCCVISRGYRWCHRAQCNIRCHRNRGGHLFLDRAFVYLVVCSSNWQRLIHIS